MARVAGVLDDPPGFPYTPPGVDVLEGGKLTSNNVVGSSHDPLQSFAVASGAVSKPGGDAAGQDALHSAGVSTTCFTFVFVFITNSYYVFADQYYHYHSQTTHHTL